MADRWTMPPWMTSYAHLITNTGRTPSVEVIEEMYNGRTDPAINLPVSTLEACVKSQVHLLFNLRDRGIIS